MPVVLTAVKLKNFLMWYFAWLKDSFSIYEKICYAYSNVKILNLNQFAEFRLTDDCAMWAA